MLSKQSISKFSIFAAQPISETGNTWIDEVVFSWALNTLHPEIEHSEAALCFAQMKSCYDDNARFFHRGLGHPRQLIPMSAERAYCKLISRTEPFLKNEEELEQLTQQFNALIPEEEKLAVAQGILGAFYHDVIHRKGHHHQALLPYATREPGCYRIDASAAPLSATLIKKETTRVVEEVSCLVAEMELSKLGVEKKLILPIILAAYCTIPFSNFSDNETFHKILTQIIKSHHLVITDKERESIYNVAVGVANRDKGAYGSDTLNEFNVKTWGMIFERNPAILTHHYTLKDLANTFHEFYSFHKSLYQQLVEGKIQIYYGSDAESDSIAILNRNALRTLELDIELNGLLLASLIVTMQLLKENHIPEANMLDDTSSEFCLKSFISRHNDKDATAINPIPDEIVSVLQQQDKEVSVNGHRFIRGSGLTALALELATCVGAHTLLQLADNYPDMELSLRDYMDNPSSAAIQAGR